MKICTFFAFLFTFSIMLTGSVWAHFGMVIPSDQMVMQGEDTDIKVDLMFWHPFEGIGMDLTKPVVFSVVVNGTNKNLLATLKSSKRAGHQTWSTNFRIKRPGVYIFHMEPQPYWETSEDCFIIHFTKTVVTSFGDDEGWGREIGLKTEIVPLSKPYGLYAGNIFQGIVKLNGKPVSYAKVEVEYYNEDGKFKAPADYMITQTIKADKSGVFTYAAPKAGWWGFAALNEADFKLKHNGKEKDVELGAVIWVRFHDMK